MIGPLEILAKVSFKRAPRTSRLVTGCSKNIGRLRRDIVRLKKNITKVKKDIAVRVSGEKKRSHISVG